MVKVKKPDRKRLKEDRAKYLSDIKKMKYGIITNIIYAMKKIGRFDRFMFISCFIFAMGNFMSRLCSTFTDKYAVELAGGGVWDSRLALICVLLILGTFLGNYISTAAGNYQGITGMNHLYNSFALDIMEKSMTTDYENNEKAQVSDSLNKARESLQVLCGNVAMNVRGSMRHTLEIFTYAGLLSVLDIRMLPVIIIPAVTCFFIERHKMKWVWNMADNWQTFDRQLSYITNVAGSFDRAKDVRIFGMQEWFEKAFARSFAKRAEWLRQQDAWEFRHSIVSMTVNFGGNFGAYAYLIYLVTTGNIAPGDFVLYFNCIFKLKEAVDAWCTNMSGYQWLCNNINYFRSYIEMEESTNRGEGEALPEGQCEIEFRNVSYTYYDADKPTIKGLSFTLHKGEKLALVGLNGAGKTTVVKLMCGLYDPTEGQILVNGIDVREFNREEYFRLFSAVFQDIAIIAAAVSENVTGVSAGKEDRDKMMSALKKAGVYDKIMSLPEKEKTLLGRSVYKDSVDLSGGERQKLSLAKALYKDAPVLILDEPTAALDPIAEQQMYMNYLEFSGGKSSLFISHRLASTRFCDRIILLEDGGIAEAGNHSELMQLSGKYAQLYELQSSYYNDEEAAG